VLNKHTKLLVYEIIEVPRAQTHSPEHSGAQNARVVFQGISKPPGGLGHLRTFSM
jgi:hypothetical protein